MSQKMSQDKKIDITKDPVLFDHIFKTTWKYYATVGALLSVVLLGVYAYFMQLKYGLGVTGMNRPVYWGVYMTNFVFFIGISHAGTLISAILRVTQAEWRRPITRAAEAITIFAICIGAPQVLIDLGRIDRVNNVILHGRFQSPILWDVCCISIYLTASLIYLYLPLIPDMAICRDHVDVGPARKKLYTILSLGWTGTKKQKKRLHRGIAIMAVIIIPIAVSVHTVVSWIFAMTLQPMWHSTILGPYFVVGAIFSGIATLIIAMVIIRKVFHLEKYLQEKHFKNLGILLLAMTLFWSYFTIAEYLTTYYGAEPSHMNVFNSKFYGAYATIFWSMIVFCVVIPFPLLAINKFRNITGILIASISINIGMWLERFTIVVPTLAQPRMPYARGIYLPTWTEWTITAASFAMLALLYCLFIKVFPIISPFELEEGEEHKQKLLKELQEEYGAVY